MAEYIESALVKNEFAIGVFLDIQGAFDNVRPASIIKGMRDKGIDPKIVHWYRHYLRNRSMEAEYKGTRITRTLTLGTPQGGVFSPIAWNINYDPFLRLFAEGLVKVCGFADDGGLVITGRNLNVMMSRIQKAVDKALEWGEASGLTFSPAKTVSVIFTRKTKFTLPNPLTMNGREIPFSDEVKYLGIIFDKRLSWVPHVRRKAKTAKWHLLKVQNAIGKLWGLQPRMARWLYTGIVRPAISYGSLVWAKACSSPLVIKELTRVNRLALMTMGHFRKGNTDSRAGGDLKCHALTPFHPKHCLSGTTKDQGAHNLSSKISGNDRKFEKRSPSDLPRILGRSW